MTPPRDPAKEVDAKSEKLGHAGHWAEVYQLLKAEKTSQLLSNENLAYRFAESLYYTGRFAELADYASVYEAASRRNTDIYGVMRAVNVAGIAAFELGRMTEAQDRFHSLMELALVEKNDEMQARAANNLGALANLHGDHDAALGYYSRCLALYEKLGQVRGLAQTMYNEGLTYSDLGRFEDAAAQFNQAIALAESLDFSPLVAMARTARAELEVRRGDHPVGRTMAERAVDLARQLEDPVSEGEALRVCALASADKSSEDALNDLAAAERCAADAGHALLQAKIDRDRGRIYRQLERRDEARRCLEAAAERFAQLGAQAEVQALRDEVAALGQGG